MIKKFKNIFKKSGEKDLLMNFAQGVADSDVEWSGKAFLRANEKSLYTNKAIAKRAEKVGETRFYVADRNGNKVENEISKLLEKPNNFQNGSEFFELFQKHKDLIGSAYIVLMYDRDNDKPLSKKITSMELVHASDMKPEYDDNGSLIGYEFDNGKRQIEYNPENVISSHYYDPKNPTQSVSLVKAGKKAIELDNILSTYHANVIQNGGQIDGVFSFEGDLTEEQINKIKRRYEEEHGDAKKAKKPLFVGGKTTYERMGATPEELSFIESKNMTLNDICIMTGVPKVLLAMFDEVKYDNAEHANRIFLKETIKPLIENLVQKLNNNNNLTDNGKYKIVYEDFVPEDIERILKENENGIKNYYLTVNEARENLGYEPIDNGDDLLVPLNVSERGAKTQSSKKKIYTKSPACRQESETKEECVERAVANSVCEDNCNSKKSPLEDYDTRRKYWKLRIMKEEENEKKFNKKLNDYFKRQKAEIINAIKKQKSLKNKNIIDETFNLAIEAKIAKDELLPFLTQYAEEAGSDAKEFSGSDFEFSPDTELNATLSKRADLFATSMNETTFDQLREDLAESVRRGEGERQLVERIESRYDNINETRAKTISRTEVGVAMSRGTYRGYKQAGVKYKIWTAVMDGQTRDSHWGLDGKKVPIDQPFDNGLEHPRDPNGSASEIINCRCTI